ncbi:MAG: hypothetical protein HC837_05555 [Chloroflexaceae bacterium]|nr:hypothetical protein [Chloroflexaceae bacterium]
MLRRRRGGLAGRGAAAETTETAAPAAPSMSRYRMRERIFAIGDDFWIEDDQGQRVFKVDGKAFRLRSTLFFEDRQGNKIYKIQEKMLRIRDTMAIYRGDDVAATVHNALFTPLRDRWKVSIPGGEDLVTQGNILNHAYQIRRGRQTVASISKKWFRIRDTYGVEVQPGEDALLVLAITVVIDMMAHSGN